MFLLKLSDFKVNFLKDRTLKKNNFLVQKWYFLTVKKTFKNWVFILETFIAFEFCYWFQQIQIS